MSDRAVYYPPGSAPQNGPHCGHKDRGDPYGDGKCQLLPGHDGDHDNEASWGARVEVEPQGRCVEISFRSWHGTRSLYVPSRQEADALLSFLAEQFDRQWPAS